MSTIRNLTAAALITLTTGCATGLNSAQESELASYRAKNLAVEEKKPWARCRPRPTSGRRLVLWSRLRFWRRELAVLAPLNSLGPVSGHDAAEFINYQATKAHVATLKKHDMDELDAKLESDAIDLKRYTLDKRRIDDKYNL